MKGGKVLIRQKIRGFRDRKDATVEEQPPMRRQQ